MGSEAERRHRAGCVRVGEDGDHNRSQGVDGADLEVGQRHAKDDHDHVEQGCDQPQEQRRIASLDHRVPSFQAVK